MKDNSIPEAAETKFRQYMSEMTDVLKGFIEYAGQAGYRLDYSLESLDALEELWFALHPTEPDLERLCQHCVRYYGEVFRTQVGGHWSLHVDPGDMYHLLPVIDEYAPRCLPFCPQAHFKMFQVRLWRGHLRKMLEQYRKVRLRPNAR